MATLEFNYSKILLFSNERCTKKKDRADKGLEEAKANRIGKKRKLKKKERKKKGKGKIPKMKKTTFKIVSKT